MWLNLCYGIISEENIGALPMDSYNKDKTELDNLVKLFLPDTHYECDVKNHRNEKNDFRANISLKSNGEALVIKLAENDFTDADRISVWKHCAEEYKKLGYYCPDIYTDKSGNFPTVEFKGHNCVSWAEEYSKYHTADDLRISRDSYWNDAMIMTAKTAACKFDFADFPSAYCLFDTFCPSDETDEVMSNAVLWKQHAETLPNQFQKQVKRIWERWLDNRTKLQQIYSFLPTSVFQADLNPSNILLDDNNKFVGVLDFNLCGKDVFLNYLFRENHFGSFNEELNTILRALDTVKSVYRFTDTEKEAALLLYRCLKPLWFTRYNELKSVKNDITLIKNSLDETEYAQTRKIDFSSVMSL